MRPADPGPFFERAPEPALVLDAGGRVVAANAAFRRTFGWARPEGASVLDATRPTDRPALACALDRPGEGRSFEAGLTPPRGPEREVAWRLSPGPEGARFAILRDMGDRRRAERHGAAVERMTGVGSWDRDVGGERLYWSPGVRAIHAVGPGFDPARADRMAFYTGESRARVGAALAALEAHGTPFDLEAALRDAQGRDRWVRVTGEAEMRRGRVERVHGTLRDVTEERCRRRLLERLGAVARLTTSAVVISDADGRIEWVNDAFSIQTGYAAGEVIGRPATVLDSPRNEPSTMRALAAALVEGRPLRTELLNRRREGREIRVEIDLQPLLDPEGGRPSWIAVRTDVTRRREDEARLARAERAASESREQLLAAVEVLDDGFVLYDRDDRMVVCNERYRQLYAKSAHAMVPGATFEAVLRAGLENGQYPDSLGREEAWLAQRLAVHVAAERSVEQALPDDRWLRVVERATPDGGRVGLRVDITELKRQQWATEDARRRAEAASEAKSQFLATMSHEIRTPMNGILGLADLLSEGAADPEQARLLADLRLSGEGLLTILNDILDFSKIEAGRMTLEAIGFEPREIARRVEALHGPLARDKGLGFRVEVQDGPARLGDPTRLMQVLGNLVSNALKFTHRGGVRLVVRNPSDGPLHLAVVDTGIGMSCEEAARVFERFSQADGSVTRRFGGTGLGLSIVHGLVEAMGGRIDVDAAPGRGTRIEVEIDLPLASRAAEPAPAARVGDLAGVRVLAADDNAMNRRVLSGLLRRLGAQAQVVASGAEAVEAAGAEAFDLVLLDISMPDMDGVEALGRIREGERAAHRAPVPALAVTANVLEDQVAGYLASGFAAHLAKPVRLAGLAEAGAAALREAGGRAQTRPLADSRMAAGRVSSISASTITRIEVSGTDRMAPATPHSAPQNASASSTTKGERLNARPIRRGSSTEPT